MTAVEIDVTDRRAPKVVIDGVDLARSISGFDLSQDAREPVARLVLDVPVTSYRVAGEMKVVLGNGVEDLLMHLGWTPPPDPAVVLPPPLVEHDPVGEPPSS